jgi:hypothetical protein
MKKGKMIISALALVVALGTAFAFKAKTMPGNLWYYHSEFGCVQAPCATFDQGTGTLCLIPVLYMDPACNEVYFFEAWETECGH